MGVDRSVIGKPTGAYRVRGRAGPGANFATR